MLAIEHAEYVTSQSEEPNPDRFDAEAHTPPPQAEPRCGAERWKGILLLITTYPAPFPNLSTTGDKGLQEGTTEHQCRRQP